jgi:glutamate-ammonia-ligase adenylyltransferase
MLATNPNLIKDLPSVESNFIKKNYKQIFLTELKKAADFAEKLAVLRKVWSRLLLEIVVFDAFEKISLTDAKIAQTELAEASVEIAVLITKSELERKFSVSVEKFHFAVLGLGKLGGGGMDYNSDLDLILLFDDEKVLPVENSTHAEFYSRAAEIFVIALSSLDARRASLPRGFTASTGRKKRRGNHGKNGFLNYLEKRAHVWEWLAYVKATRRRRRFALARAIETDARNIITKTRCERTRTH